MSRAKKRPPGTWTGTWCELHWVVIRCDKRAKPHSSAKTHDFRDILPMTEVKTNDTSVYIVYSHLIDYSSIHGVSNLRASGSLMIRERDYYFTSADSGTGY